MRGARVADARGVVVRLPAAAAARGAYRVHSSESAVLDLQRSAGNRAVASLISPARGALAVQRWATQSRGASSVAVERVQRALNRTEIRGRLAEDGIFGPRTEAAVKRFQAAIRTRPTGVVNTETWRALQAGGRGSATSPEAEVNRLVIQHALLRLMAQLSVGADQIARAPNAAEARKVAARVMRHTRRTYRAAALVMSLNPALPLRQRRAATYLRVVFTLLEAMPAATPVPDPRALTHYLQLFAMLLGSMTVNLITLSPQQFVQAVPSVMAAGAKILAVMTPYLQATVAPTPPATPAVPASAAGGTP
jgi:peptidoglycan hydrolase-like protein with peptidoglycan-binding domain